MKGNLIRATKKTVIACIMIAALTVSASENFYVSAEDAVSGGDAVSAEPIDDANATPADETDESDFQEEISAQTTDDVNDRSSDGNLPQTEEDNRPESLPAFAENADSTELNAADTAAEKNEPASSVSVLNVSGTTDYSAVYDGNDHNVTFTLPVTTINVGGTDVTAVTATGDDSQIFYIAGIPENKLTVTARDVTSVFEASLPAVTVYDSSIVEVSGPSTISIAADNVITKRTVELVSMNVVKSYDGTPLTNGGMPLATEDGWVDGQGANYTFTKSRTAVGTDFNEFEISSYKEGTNPDNYTINRTFGALTVADRTEAQKYVLTVDGGSTTVKYSGQQQNVSSFILEGRSDADYQVRGNGDPSQVYSLVIGNATFTVTGIAAYGSGKNAGEYPVSITGSPVIRDLEGNDVTGQFKFEIKPGTLTIEKRNVILTSGSLKVKFDNKTHKKHKVTVSGDGFAEGEGATYSYTGKQKAVGESYNYFTYKLNEGTLQENYDIEKVPGVLTVKKNDTAINLTPADNNDNDDSSSDSGAAKAQTESPAQGTVAAKPQGTEPAGTPAQADPNVLGAKRDTGDVTVDIANPIDDNVLGARRGSTDDYSDLGRHTVAFAAAVFLMTLLTIRRNKRIRK